MKYLSFAIRFVGGFLPLTLPPCAGWQIFPACTESAAPRCAPACPLPSIPGRPALLWL
ncbi:hypothetical protein [Neisseria musculi]|uniref:hypothetical protein n=1 Tax=Neisseria musculi TaxID=1815583 RepID=UPI00164B2E37